MDLGIKVNKLLKRTLFLSLFLGTPMLNPDVLSAQSRSNYPKPKVEYAQSQSTDPNIGKINPNVYSDMMEKTGRVVYTFFEFQDHSIDWEGNKIPIAHIHANVLKGKCNSEKLESLRVSHISDDVQKVQGYWNKIEELFKDRKNRETDAMAYRTRSGDVYTSIRERDLFPEWELHPDQEKAGKSFKRAEKYFNNPEQKSPYASELLRNNELLRPPKIVIHNDCPGFV